MSNELPPLPEPAGFTAGLHDGALFTTKRRTGENFSKGSGAPLLEWYSAEQVRAAVAAEREACARLVETQDTYGDSVGCWFETLAAKIRARATMQAHALSTR